MAEPGPGSARREVWRDLRRAWWRILGPQMAVWLVAAPGIVYLLAITGDWPPEALRSFLVPGSAVMAALLLLTLGRSRERMPTLWALGEPGRTPTREELGRALSELSAFPSFVFYMNFQHWFLALLGLTAVMAQFAELTSAAPMLRLLVAGGVSSPFTGMVSRFLGQWACRHAIQRIVHEGLSADEVFKAIPPDRSRLRSHMITFVIFALLFPAVFSGDVAFSGVQREMEVLVRESNPVLRARLAEVLGRQQAWPPYVLLALSSVASLVTAFLAGTILRQPLRRLGEQGLRFSGAESPVEVIPAEEEAWVVSVALTRMQQQFSISLDYLRSAGARIFSSGQQIGATVENQRKGADEQAASLNETFATTEELAHSAAQIAENAQEVAGGAQRTLAAAVDGQGRAEQFHASVLRMKLDNQAVADSVVKLNKRMQQIGQVVQFIDEIADKSDLLALNAELEGTKAGRVGKGFSLVAAEMRRLSESVMRSTREIGRLIQEIRDATNTAVLATEAGLKATEAGARSADRMMFSLAEILGLASRTSDEIRAISLATQQQQTVTGQLASAMAEILLVTEQSTEAAHQIAGATGDLSEVARDLTSLLETFGNSAPPPPAVPPPAEGANA